MAMTKRKSDNTGSHDNNGKHRNGQHDLSSFQTDKSLHGEKKRRPPDFDTVLEDVGEFSWAQRIHLAILCYASWTRGMFIMAVVFLGKSPGFYCKDRPAENNDPCSPPCQAFTYNSNFTSAVSEWDLVCEKKEYVGLIQSGMMLGMLLGNFFLAPLVDNYGRWRIMVLSNVIVMISHVGTSYCQSYTQFIITRIALGVGLGGTLANSVWITENIHSRWRSMFSLLHNTSNAIGGVLLAAFAFYLRDWRDQTFYTGCCLIPFLFLCRYVPESPRWLVSEGRVTEAEDILLDIARTNGAVVSREHIKMSLEKMKSASKSSDVKSINIAAMFRTYGMRRRLLTLMFIWATCVMVYYSLSLGTTNLEGNMYINVAVSGLTEIPITFIIDYLCIRFGRKNSTIGCTLLGAFGCLAFVLLPRESGGDMTQYHTWFVLAGKTGIAASFSLMYVFTGELLPTVVRGSGFAICTTAGRLGGIAGPFISTMGDTFAYLIYGLMCLVACVLCLDLPETLNEPLPDTIEDIEKYYTDHLQKTK